MLTANTVQPVPAWEYQILHVILSEGCHKSSTVKLGPHLMKPGSSIGISIWLRAPQRLNLGSFSGRGRGLAFSKAFKLVALHPSPQTPHLFNSVSRLNDAP
jgi:hypothetical protein